MAFFFEEERKEQLLEAMEEEDLANEVECMLIGTQRDRVQKYLCPSL